MMSLRSIRLILSLGMVNLSLIHCAADTPDPQMPEGPGFQDEDRAEWANPPAAVQPAEHADSPEHADSQEHAAAHPAHAAHWAYVGDEGPSKWGELGPDFAACKDGQSQSPIDIVKKDAVKDAKLDLIEFAYSKIPLAIFNNGHTVQVANDGPSAINAAGQTWKLAQFHFHSPSEHAFDGKLMDAEMHFVHKNDKGELAVVGLLFKKGKENKALDAVFDSMPSEVSGEAAQVAGKSVDLSSIVPDAPSYFTYMGSLTTPKCTEGVRWFVLEPVSQISDAQLEKFRSVTHSDTNRPVQPLGSRAVSRPN